MIDNGIVVTGFIGLISTIVGSWSSYFFTRKKYNSEVDLNLIDKMQKSLEFYMQLSEDNKHILEETLNKVNKLEKSNDILEKENRELKNQMLTFMSQVCTELSCCARKNYIENKPKTSKKVESKVNAD